MSRQKPHRSYFSPFHMTFSLLGITSSTLFNAKIVLTSQPSNSQLWGFRRVGSFVNHFKPVFLNVWRIYGGGHFASTLIILCTFRGETIKEVLGRITWSSISYSGNIESEKDWVHEPPKRNKRTKSSLFGTFESDDVSIRDKGIFT